LRVPGRSALAVIDARLRMAALAAERPTAAESAPRSQGTLRNALEGAKLTGADLVVPQDRSASFPRLAFGDRFLIAEEALLLIDAPSSKVLWASSGAQRRPGSTYPAAEAVALGDAPPLEAREELVRDALAREEQAGVAARRKELVARLRSRVQKLRRTLSAGARGAALARRIPPAARRPRGARPGLVAGRRRGPSRGSSDCARSGAERCGECTAMASAREALPGSGGAHRAATA